MRFASLALMLFPILASAGSTGFDIPLGIFDTRQSLFLQGTPQRLEYKSYKCGARKDACEFYVSEEVLYDFDESGLAIRRQASSGPAGSLEVRKSAGRISGATFFPAYSDGFNEFTPFQYDEKNRIVAFRTAYSISGGSRAQFSTPMTFSVSYEKGRQELALYKDGMSTSQAIYELNREGAVKSQCFGSCEGPGGISHSYGKFGPERIRDGALTRMYEYADGLLQQETTVTTADDAEKKRVRFSNYKLDSCGNWTYRESVAFPAEGDRGRGYETRSIQYFAPCKKSWPL